jgi:glycerol-3-phosphate dehydrogenase
MTNPQSLADRCAGPPGRDDALGQLARSTLDILVIGGGVVGAGIARDAAMRGLKVGLLEQQDFAFGTSSRSSRLLHGGLRYLAQGRIGLVREASVEKKILHQIASHLAQPLPFIFPTYRGSKEWILWQLKIGVKIYDLLCRGRNLGASSWLRKSDVLERVPGLIESGLNGAVRYFDGFTNDARLVIDTLRSAAKHGAIVANYCKFTNGAAGAIWECAAHDALCGGGLEIRARAVVNATGPWADGLPHSAVKLRLTKGVHLVVHRERLPVTETIVLTEGKRILFAIPWGDRVILGTTDTDYSGPLDSITADRGDILHVLGVVNQFFPSAALREDDVISTWAGVRPLIADSRGRPSDISRSHEIRNPEPGWWDVAGGKLTTYRLMAEQTVDRILASFRKAGTLPQMPLPCRTAVEPLLTPLETSGISGIVPPPMDRITVEHFCRNEWAMHLPDVMVRRAGWHYYFPDAQKRAEDVATWMAEALGWSEEQRESELSGYVSSNSLFHSATAPVAGPA